MKTRRTFDYIRLLAAVASVLLFAWMVSQTGLATIFDQTRLLGAGLVLLILLSGARHPWQGRCGILERPLVDWVGG